MKHSAQVLVACSLLFAVPFSQALAVTNTTHQQDLQRIAKKEARIEKELREVRKEMRDMRKHNNAYSTPAQKQRPIHRRKPETKPIIHRELTYLGGMPVITSPYLGVRSAFDGSDLIVNISSINEDVRLLLQRKTIAEMLLSQKKHFPEHPMIELSGKLEGYALGNWPYSGSRTGDINLKSAEIDVATYINPWITGFFAIKYDNAPPQLFSQRAANSRLFLNKGFITLGNMQETPFYATLGQLYVPFGLYSSRMLTSTLPYVLGATRSRAFVVGYNPVADSHLYGAAYIFHGDILSPGRVQGGANLGYRYRKDHVFAELGASVISNIAESDGFQATGSSVFPGFGASPATQRLVSRVPGVGTHLKLSYGNHSLKSEYVAAVTRFNAADLTFNGRGARPWAVNVEYNYGFELKKIPGAISFGYGHSGEAYALTLPRDTLITSLCMSFWKDTLATLEYVHSYNYPVGTTGTGRGQVGTLPSASLGKTADSLIFQFGIYF